MLYPILVLASGNVICYWWFQLKNHSSRENMRIELTLTSFLGIGSVPRPEGIIEFIGIRW